MLGLVEDDLFESVELRPVPLFKSRSSALPLLKVASQTATPSSSDPKSAMWRDLVALPWRHYEVTSPLNQAQIAAALQAATTLPSRWSGFWPRTQSADFEGTVTPGGFTISRIIRYRNSFLPVITGHIDTIATGARVTISMRLSWFILVFWVVWMTGVASSFGFLLFKRQGVHNRVFGIAVISGMLLFGYLLCTMAFGLEARRASTYCRRS
jgi:hypothetical protein